MSDSWFYTSSHIQPPSFFLFCVIIQILFLFLPSPSDLCWLPFYFFAVSGASGTGRPESRSVPQDLCRRLNRPLRTVTGWADQKDKSRQAKNHRCWHSYCRGVSLYFLCWDVPVSLSQNVNTLQRFGVVVFFSLSAKAKKGVRKTVLMCTALSNKVKTTSYRSR